MRYLIVAGLALAGLVVVIPLVIVVRQADRIISQNASYKEEG